jgi:hypothetical protein
MQTEKESGVTKQLLYYENAVPLTPQLHGDLSLEKRSDFDYAGHSNSVPLVAPEFAAAAAEYPIVFSGTGSAAMPVVILGVRSDENFYLDNNNQWTASYIPAFVRRYPFVFAQQQDSDRFTLCIDESYHGWNRESRGDRLFEANGEGTRFLNRVVEFVQEYQRDYLRTQALCRRLEELELLTPMAARFNLPSGDKAQLTGFKAIDREKVAALPGDTLAEMAKSGELELIYIHLYSMRNLQRIVSGISMNAADVSTSESREDEAYRAAEKPLH